MLFGHALNDVRWYSSLEAAKPGEPLRAADRPEWTSDRPATTVQADPRIGRPGRKDWAGGESQFTTDSIRVSVTEAGVLQSFPAAFGRQACGLVPLDADNVAASEHGQPFIPATGASEQVNDHAARCPR